MDPFHARLARIGLGAAAGYGFVLAGGYAVQAHGFLERLSDDVDLFTDIADPVAFSEAVDAVAAAYRRADLTVEVEKSGGVFARFAVADEQGHMAKVELGCDWRARPPAVLEIGPVLHPDDAVANKVTTLFGRAAPRDYLDVNAALASGRYSGGRLLQLASEHDAGFEVACRGPTVTSVCLSVWLTASSGAQLRSRWWAGDNPSGGQPVDRRLWTVHHGVVRPNLPNVL
ncbi:nucleotidyl transferase AbiEii/AbiGii toxin family protein [Actinacidiphila soli]|uniref:nucleotidyl transferase AbiEii/AbiGii toxin family protein n=1 Tax=Actinacidiphila soli TaxID=2487275 RepID=UPI000FCC2588|nr:nucleotidyl transferase AbiEii/AbiGii toxin family protein [Actinacidiphila soli]